MVPADQGELRSPPHLALDFLDELADLGRRRLGLLALDADQGLLVLLKGKPEFRQSVRKQSNANNGQEQPDVFAEQAATRRGLSRRSSRLISRGRFHSITSSARARSVVGTSSPRDLAVFRLRVISTLVGCWTGRSGGCAPLRIRPVERPTGLYASARLAP